MNQLEREMVDILKELREEYGAVSVKAEFEAEGTRTDELLRLIDLARRVDLKVGLKIGGCEAVRDLIESKQFGTEYIIAPMVETNYALQKFILAVNKVYSKDQQKSTDFLYNVETIDTYNALNEMSETAKNASEVQGMVFGRVDFVTSLGMPRSDINTQKISEYVFEVAKKCKECELDLVINIFKLLSLPNGPHRCFWCFPPRYRQWRLRRWSHQHFYHPTQCRHQWLQLSPSHQYRRHLGEPYYRYPCYPRLR